ncbi:hypothetical protein A2368_01595 [Candidatus Collierbacteria bacterium RIFOXYB1_FULL_49_13]|uniref:Uncharacterized protein n=1 Tax=Candidatus Collierbacteria bacterium RIFOXYB1_FULL_49_13 TaxID=1817728 RepID=A0A1F5FFL2_9BACT|nr:MAG: hypothetical protein A2368_01595 [Candidatus Collierbacteria bacterium RIFOXYB1_FULL_49_13]
MKKKITLSILISEILNLISAPLAHAASLSDVYLPGKALGGSGATIGGFVTPLIQNLALLMTGLTFIILLLSGFKYITSHGNPKGTQQAKDMLTYSLVGLVLSIAAYWITKLAFVAAGLDFLF